MTDPRTDPFENFRLPVSPLEPRSTLVDDLRVRVHRRLGLAAPPGFVPMRKAAGLEYEVGGAADGDAVLLVHAGIATAFRALMDQPALAERYRLLRYHRRGYAGSDPFDGEVTIRRHVDDAVAFLDHLEISRAHVVGHSGSGVIALQLALDAPERVGSLVFEEPAFASIRPEWQAMMHDVIARPVARARSGDERGAVDQWMRGVSDDWRTELTRSVPGGPQQTLDDAAAFFADVDPVDAWRFDHARVAEVAVPVLYVLGADSPAYAAAVMRAFQAVVVQTETAVIPGAGHMLHADQPERVAVALGEFFARHPLASEGRSP
jgi:pimeloyl-ACP methyl ester carboxylesterase